MRDAFNRVEREKEGVGCGCARCAHAAVKDINWWLDMYAPEGSNLGAYKYEVVADRKGFRIEQVIERERWAKD